MIAFAKIVKLSAAISGATLLFSSVSFGQAQPTNPNPGGGLGPYWPPGGCSCECPEECPGFVSTSSASNSIYFNMDLGRASFARKLNYFRAGAAPGMALNPNFSLFHRSPFNREYPASLNFYKQASATARRNYRLYLAEENILSTSFQPAALVADSESGAETLYDSSGAVRQILTDDVFADIQPISAVWSTLPSDIKSVVASTSSGFVVQTWFADGMSPTGSLHSLPSGDRLAYYVFYNPDSSLGTTRHLAVIQKYQYGSAYTSYKNKTWVFEQNTTNHNWVTKQYQDIPSTIPSTTLPLQETDLTVTTWAGTSGYTQTRTLKQLPFNSDGSFGTALMTVSNDQEIYSSISGVLRLTKRIQGFGTSSPRTTQYDYYSDSANSYSYGRLKWQSNPDSSFEYYVYSGFDSVSGTGVIYKYTPARNYKWSPGSTAPNFAMCEAETTILTQSSADTSKTLDGVQIARKVESVAYDSNTCIVTEKSYTTASSSSALITVTGYYYDATFTASQSNKIKWRELSDGTAEVYSYVSNSLGGTTDTTIKGEGNRTGITKGVKTVQKRNRRGEIVQETIYYINGGTSSTVQMSEWVADSTDNFGRVLHRIWNADSTDSESFAYNCCGLLSSTDRKGILSEFTRDDLKRISNIKVTSGSWVLEDQTAFHEASGGGLITTNSKKGTQGSSSSTVLVKEIRYGLNGEVIQISTPDQNNDGFAEITSYSYALAADSSPPASGDGRVVTATYPDGSTIITGYWIDGRVHSKKGTAIPDVQYDYSTHSVVSGVYDGPGLVIRETKLSSSGALTEYQDFSYDLAGRILLKSAPNHTGSGSAESATWSYYSASTGLSGQRGKLLQYSDFDGIVQTYNYDTEGRANTLADLTTGGGQRTKSLTMTAISSVPSSANTINFSGPAYQITASINDGSSTVTSNSYVVGSYDKGQRLTDYNRVSSTTYNSGSTPASWTETTTTPTSSSSYTRDVREYVNALLVSHNQYDSSGNILSGESYTYDPLGRTASKQDARTGVIGKILYTYSEAGGILSEQEGNGRGCVYTRDPMGRIVTQSRWNSSNTNLNQTTSYTYYPSGKVKAKWGKQIYPCFYIYDEQNRLIESRTYQSLGSSTEPSYSTGGSASSFWVYDSGRGWLVSETDAASNSTSYGYTAAGRLLTKTGARGYVTTNVYTSGYLTARTYSASSGTPNVSYSYDGFGRLINLVQVDQVTSKIQSKFDYHYDASNFKVDYETVSYMEQSTAGVFALVRKISHSIDGLDRPAGVSISNVSTAAVESNSSVTYSTNSGRIDTISGLNMGVFTYSYVPNSNLVSRLDTGLFSRIFSYDSARDLISGIENKIGTSTTVSQFTYGINDMSQRDSVTTSGSGFSGSGDWNISYDDRGEVSSADSSLASFDRAYQYDSIGNRQKSVEGSLVLPSVNNYSVNSINQYTSVASGSVPSFDYDGNQTSGTVKPVSGAAVSSTMTWDAENRLTSVTSSGATVKFYYDPLGRRIAKQIPNGGAGLRYAYIYDGWNVVGQYYIGTPTVVNVQSQFFNMWGPDISKNGADGSGVGGLLATRGGINGHTFDVGYDGNGNVSEYVEINGSTLSVGAHFEYDPFGRILKDSDVNQQFDFRYSTKPVDMNTGLIYYGYRWYDPGFGRWLSEDPIGQVDSSNLYAFLKNDPINSIDYRGLWQVTLFGGDGLGGYLTFGKNGGQWNLGIRLGVGGGFSMGFNPMDTGPRPEGAGAAIGIDGSVGDGKLGASGSASMDSRQGDDVSGSVRYGPGCIGGGMHNDQPLYSPDWKPYGAVGGSNAGASIFLGAGISWAGKDPSKCELP